MLELPDKLKINMLTEFKEIKSNFENCSREMEIIQENQGPSLSTKNLRVKSKNKCTCFIALACEIIDSFNRHILR